MDKADKVADSSNLVSKPRSPVRADKAARVASRVVAASKAARTVKF